MVSNDSSNTALTELSQEDYQGRDLEALSNMRRYRRWIMTHFSPFIKGDVAEIGAGIGNMSDHFYPLVESLDLVEPSERLAESLEEKFGRSKIVKIVRRTFEEFVSIKPVGSYDCIIMVNVLEHIKEDRGALIECHRLLRHGGYLLIMVPALKFLYSQLDQVVGHHRRYEYDELKTKIKEVEFDLIDLRFFDSIGIIPWYILNTIAGATQFNRTLVGLYDQLFVPVTQALESIYKPPLGKNLIAISRRI